MYIIILIGISQPDIIEAILERILVELDNSDTIASLEKFNGHLVIFELLRSSSDKIIGQSTSILLHLVQCGNRTS
jgi:hypothetical protein